MIKLRLGGSLVVAVFFLMLLMIPQSSAIQGQNQTVAENVQFNGLAKVLYSGGDSEWVQLTSDDAWMYDFVEDPDYNVINFDVTTLELYFTITNQRETAGTYYQGLDIILKLDDGSGWETIYSDSVMMACDNGDIEIRQYDVDVSGSAAGAGVLLTEGDILQLYVRDSEAPGEMWFVNFFEIEVDISEVEETPSPEAPEEDLPEDDDSDGTNGDTGDGDGSTDDGSGDDSTPDTPEDATGEQPVDETEDQNWLIRWWNELVRIVRENLNL